MTTLKLVGLIFLAIYLILGGLAAMAEIHLVMFAAKVLDLIAVASGILILVSIGRFMPEHK